MSDALGAAIAFVFAAAVGFVAFSVGYTMDKGPPPLKPTNTATEQLTERMIVNACYARVAFGIEVGGVTSYFTCQPININTTTVTKKGNK